MTISQCYTILNLPYNATADEVKKAYRMLAKQYHPDRNNNSTSHNDFILIETAYSTVNRYLSAKQQPVYSIVDELKRADDINRAHAERVWQEKQKKKKEQEAKINEYIDFYYDGFTAGWRKTYSYIISIAGCMLSLLLLIDSYLAPVYISANNVADPSYIEATQYSSKEVISKANLCFIRQYDVAVGRSQLFDKVVSLRMVDRYYDDEAGFDLQYYDEYRTRSIFDYIFIITLLLLSPITILIFKKRNILFPLVFYRYMMYGVPVIFTVLLVNLL